MKKNVIMFFVAVFFASCSSSVDETDSANNSTNVDLSQYISTPCSDFVKFNTFDSTFLNFLISKGYDINNDSKISCSEALLVTDLNFGNNGYVTNTEGIEQFINLKTIKGYINTCKSTDCVSILNLYNNINLISITLNETRNYTNNGVNVAEYGHVKTIVLPNSTSLIKFYSPNTHFDKVLNISNQTNLKILNLNDSNLSGELNLNNCSVLQSINLSRNELNKIRFSETINPHLDTLKLGLGNYVTSDPYSVNSNSLTDISVSTFPNLKYLDLQRNRLKNLDLSANVKISYLNLGSNELLTLNLQNNTLLKFFIADNNKISILNTSSLTNLRSFSMINNLLTNIDLSSNTNLYTVNLNNNDLVSLNLKNGKNSFLYKVVATQNTINCIKIDNGFTPNPSNWLKDISTTYCY